MNSIQKDEDRPAWLREHGAWIKAMQRRVNMVNRSSDWRPGEFINLTTIRHRFEPAEHLSAMEEARRLDSAERRREWTLAILQTIAIVLVVMLWTKLLMMWMR